MLYKSILLSPCGPPRLKCFSYAPALKIDTSGLLLALLDLFFMKLVLHCSQLHSRWKNLNLCRNSDNPHITSKSDGVLYLKSKWFYHWCGTLKTNVLLDCLDSERASLITWCFTKLWCIQQTNYISQFLWRDLNSSFDIVSPYFTSSETFAAMKIYAHVMEIAKIFHVSLAMITLW